MIESIDADDISNWTYIEVLRANLYKWTVTNSRFGNELQYEEIYNWCKNSIPKDDWVSMITFSGIKQFYFKDPKYVTLFMLRWGSVVDIT